MTPSRLSGSASTARQRETSRISVPAEYEQAGIVRQFVRLACHRYGCDLVTDNVLQVADELVGNAVGHASDPSETLEIGIVPTQQGVRIEVHDHSHPAPGDMIAPGETEPTGLSIVASLSDEWGITDDSDGKTIWAEMTAKP